MKLVTYNGRGMGWETTTQDCCSRILVYQQDFTSPRNESGLHDYGGSDISSLVPFSPLISLFFLPLTPLPLLFFPPSLLLSFFPLFFISCSSKLEVDVGNVPVRMKQKEKNLNAGCLQYTKSCIQIMLSTNIQSRVL